MLLVVATRHLGSDLSQLRRGQPQTLALEPPDDLSDEAPLHGVGLDDDQGSFHGAGTVASIGPGPNVAECPRLTPGGRPRAGGPGRR